MLRKLSRTAMPRPIRLGAIWRRAQPVLPVLGMLIGAATAKLGYGQWSAVGLLLIIVAQCLAAAAASVRPPLAFRASA